MPYSIYQERLEDPDGYQTVYAKMGLLQRQRRDCILQKNCLMKSEAKGVGSLSDTTRRVKVHVPPVSVDKIEKNTIS